MSIILMTPFIYFVNPQIPRVFAHIVVRKASTYIVVIKEMFMIFLSWMYNHNRVGLVSRDRSTAYSSAIRSIDRPIIEIADKFHLIKNMSECFTKLIGEHYSDYRNAIRGSQVVKDELMYNEPKDFKPIKKEVETRFQLVPIKLLSSMVTRTIFSKKRNSEDEQLIELMSRFTWFNQMYEASNAFYELITGNDPVALIRWMRKFWKTKVNTLKAFITGIKTDFKAVRNTIKYNVTNGITEGFVNKLKVIRE
jgi:transposase